MPSWIAFLWGHFIERVCKLTNGLPHHSALQNNIATVVVRVR